MPVIFGTSSLPSTDRNASKTLLLATDLQRSVLAELHLDGPNHHAYIPYGSQSSRFAAGSRLGFNGELKEQPTGWYHLGNGHRVYNPVLMRFHSPDRLSPFDKGGLNSYAYCGGSPVIRVDPSGKWWVSVLGQAIGTSVGGLFAFAALNRTAQNVVKGVQATFRARLANVFGFYGGASAIAARPLAFPSAVAAALPNTLQASSVSGNAVSQALTFVGGMIANADMARSTLAAARQNGQSLWRVAGESIKEVSGYNLLRRQPTGQVPHTSDVPMTGVYVESRVSLPQVQENIRRGTSNT
jgi:RHS repeat-associated protein